MICINCSKQITEESPVLDVCANCFERRAQCVERYYAALTEWRQITGSLGRPGLPNPTDSIQKRVWKCDIGNGELDHDWQEKHDSSGELDGGPGNHFSWRECRVCGAIEKP